MSRVESMIEQINTSGGTEGALRKVHDDLRRTSPTSKAERKLLAEVSFLLARHAKRGARYDEAREYASEAVESYELLGVQDLETAAPVLYRFLPDIVHEDVVKAEFRDLLSSAD